VPEGVAGPVEAGGLAVPVAHHAVERPTAGVVRYAEGAGAPGDLGPHDRGGGGLLVEAGAEEHVVRVEELPEPGQLEVKAGQGRALVAADQARGEEGLAPAESGEVAERPVEGEDDRKEDGAGLQEV